MEKEGEMERGREKEEEGKGRAREEEGEGREGEGLAPKIFWPRTALALAPAANIDRYQPPAPELRQGSCPSLLLQLAIDRWDRQTDRRTDRRTPYR